MPFIGVPDIQMKKTEGAGRVNMAGKKDEDLKKLKLGTGKI